MKMQFFYIYAGVYAGVYVGVYTSKNSFINNELHPYFGRDARRNLQR